MTTKWGNPKTATFARQNLRHATYGDTIDIPVHKLVWPLVERIFVTLEQAGISLAGVTELADPLKQGFNLPDADPVEVSLMVRDAQFVYDGDVVRFVGTADDAQALSATIKADAVDLAAVEEEPLPEPAEEASQPFNRDVLKDEGSLRFIQYLVGAEPTGEFDEQTSDRVGEWQARWGGIRTGLVDEGMWQLIVPARAAWLRPGATGMQIKVIQSAFKANGYFDGVVNGVWGIELSRSLRRFQIDHNIHMRLRIGRPEWEALFAPDVDTPVA